MWSQASKQSRAQNHVFFAGKVAAVVAEGGSLFPRFHTSIGKLSTKRARDCSESSMSTWEHVKRLEPKSTFGRWDQQNRHHVNRVIHLIMSIHSFQFIHVNSFMSMRSWQFIYVIYVFSVMSIHSCHAFQLNKNSYKQTGSYSHVRFSKLPPQLVPGTTWYILLYIQMGGSYHMGTPNHWFSHGWPAIRMIWGTPILGYFHVCKCIYIYTCIYV